MLPTNTPAPDFSLPDNDGTPVSLKDFRGETVVLVFYPKDDSHVCTRQLNDYTTRYEAFAERGARILAISTDSVATHRKFKISCSFPFPLLSDSNKSVSRAYGALNLLGHSQRVVYVIDREGIIRYAERTLPFRYLSADSILKEIPV